MARLSSLSSVISLTILSLLFLSSSGSPLHHLHRDGLLSPKAQAERMIRSFNLFPTQTVNSRHYNNEVGGGERGSPSLVEKRFRIDGVEGEPGIDVHDLGHHAGYYKLPHAADARMFYFFFESRNKKQKDPVVIWLTGGPGCSSELALFYENGPFKIASNLSLSWNDYGWDKASNLIYVDQPIGTGFSYTKNSSDLRHDEKSVSNDLYDFLQAFFKEHPQYANNDFFITGESYAGHYIPAFASRVHQGNKNNEGIHINLKGFAIGNGLTDPAVQYAAYADYALENKLITESVHKSISKRVPNCEQSIKKCATGGEDECISAYYECTDIFNRVLSAAGDDLNYYDIRKKCDTQLCYDFSSMDTLLNLKSVRETLGVGDIEFVSCSTDVYSAMQSDWMKNLEVGIPTLLEDGINLLIYAGECDLICNWLGNSRWVHAMNWSGKKDFSAAAAKAFVVDGSEAGEMKSHGPLAFLKVYKAGHMVPMDQPKAALEMLQKWTQGKLTGVEIKSAVAPR